MNDQHDGHNTDLVNNAQDNGWPEPILRARVGRDSPSDLFHFEGAMAATTMPERSLRRAMAEERIGFVRVSSRVIRFRRDDLEEFMESCRVARAV